jgi:CBS domain-containing protein
MIEGSVRELSPQSPPATSTVAGVMRPPLTTVEQRGHLAAAAYLMRRAGASALVVLEDEKVRRPVGLITEADIVEAVADGTDLEEARIRDLMTLRPIVVNSATSVRDAAESMLSGKIRHLPVVDDAGLVGIVEIGDICRALLGPPPTE